MPRARTALGACSLLLLCPSAAGAQTAALRVDDGDAGRTLTVAHHGGGSATVRLDLEQNASTGSVWRFTERPARSILRFRSAAFTPPSGDDGIVGAPGTKTYTWRTAGRGTTTLRLALRGPGDGAVLDRFRVTIRVT